MSASPTRALPALALVALVSMSLAACGTEQETPVPETSATASATPTPTATATPEPTEAASTPVTISCDELISPEAIYDFNPNFTLDVGYAPPAGSDAAAIVEADGIACSWLNATSGETIEVAVAQPAPETLEAIKNELVVSSNPVPTYEVEGYFEVAGTVGIAEAFAGPFRIMTTSTFYIEPGDAQPIIAAARAGLGQ